MKLNMYVLYGGKSTEHEVSIISATSVLNSIDKEKYNVYPVFISKEGQWARLEKLENNIENQDDLVVKIDKSVTESLGEFISSIDYEASNMVFPVLHGNNGEDGTIQGLLELINIPYIGNEVLSSALCMDKIVTNDILKTHGIEVAEYISVYRNNWEESKENVLLEIEEKIGLPVYVKPANGGSSVGVTRAGNTEELIDSINIAFIYDAKIIVQKEVVGKEIETCVIGNSNPKASLSGELEMENAFYDYESKYIKKAAVPVIPANIDVETSERAKKIALDSYKVMGCSGIARVDIFVTEDNEILVNEINTMPGFTSISMAPMLWQKTDGSSFTDLIEELIVYGLDRFKEKNALSKVKVTN